MKHSVCSVKSRPVLNAWDDKMFANLIEMNLYRFSSFMHMFRG